MTAEDIAEAVAYTLDGDFSDDLGESGAFLSASADGGSVVVTATDATDGTAHKFRAVLVEVVEEAQA